ncbi:unnamed protein product, partial [Mesorhabditis belari]|uniref:Uncharacterized protein n=1 Tax=Mesorhabditis belari TaxID=2138241 RepID=A0AAF3F6G6_9BILA
MSHAFAGTGERSASIFLLLFCSVNCLQHSTVYSGNFMFVQARDAEPDQRTPYSVRCPNGLDVQQISKYSKFFIEHQTMANSLKPEFSLVQSRKLLENQHKTLSSIDL